MKKLKLEKSEFKTLVENIVKEELEESKKKNKKKRKFDKVMHEFGNGTLKTPQGKIVTDRKQAIAIAYSESGLDEETLKEWKPNVGFDEWANLETGGKYGQGVQNRKNFTRKQNSKGEKLEKLDTIEDFTKLLGQWGKSIESSEENSEKILRLLMKKYTNGNFNLGDLNTIALFGPIQGSDISEKLKDFVEKENAKTGFYPTNFDSKNVDFNQ